MSLEKDYPVRFLQQVLGFCRSSYYALKRKLREPQKGDRELRVKIGAVALKRPAYGYRRITHELKREGHDVNHKRIYALMRDEGLLCKRTRKWTKTTDSIIHYQCFPIFCQRLT